MTAPVSAHLTAAERMALRRFAADRDLNLEDAAATALRDFLIAGGWLEWSDDDDGAEDDRLS